jgi:hypothetical protein
MYAHMTKIKILKKRRWGGTRMLLKREKAM